MGQDQRPSFFITGHSKCGTTALANFLVQHPDIFMCTPKEPNYFVPSWCRADGPPSHFAPRTEAEYLELFAGAEPGQLCGEASAAYLLSPEAPELIHRFDPAAKLIMIFREPAAFVHSYHLQALRNTPEEGETVKELAEALRLEDDRRTGRSIPKGCVVPELLFYRDRVRYADQYDRFARLFPREQILPLVFEDFRRDNAGTVRRVLDFLGVDPAFEPELADHNAGGVSVRSRSALRWARRATHGGGAFAVGRALVPRRIRRRAIEGAYRSLVFERAPALDPAVAAELRELAYPQVEALGERIGRDLLAEWSYRPADRPAVTSA